MEQSIFWVIWAAIIVLIVILLANSIKVAMEYQRGVLFRLGRFHKIKGPGIYLKLPIIDIVRTVSLRIETNEISQQEMITKDSISLLLGAAGVFKVTNPQAPIIEVRD